MGNLFTRKRSFDSIVLDELNRPLISDVSHNLFSRLNVLEHEFSDLKQKIENIEDTLKTINENISHRNINTNNEIYKINESIHNICDDMQRLVKNDLILKKNIDDIDKRTSIQALYTLESEL